MKEVQPRVGELCKAWQQRIGIRCICPAPCFSAVPPHCCENLVGSGLCVETMDLVRYHAVSDFLKRSNRWALIFKTPATTLMPIAMRLRLLSAALVRKQ